MARKARKLTKEEQKLLEEEFRLLEQKLKILRAEYNQFFIGARKDPPNFTEAAVQRIIHKYAGDATLRGQERFKYYNLVARYTTMREYWSRRLRAREKGAARGSVLSPEVEKQRSALMDRRLSSQYARTIRNTDQDDESVRRLFVGYMRASRSVGGESKLKLDEFREIVRSKTESLQKRKSCDGVQFRISVEDGRVKLKAKPAMDGSSP